MGKDCSVKLVNTKVYKALEQKFGKDNVSVLSNISKVFDGESFTYEFSQWFKKQTNREPNLNSTKANELVDAIVRFKPNSVNNFAKNKVTEQRVKLFGYDGMLDREEGITHSASFLLKEFINVKDTGKDTGKNVLNYYFKSLQSNWRDLVYNRVAEKLNISVDELRAKIKEINATSKIQGVVDFMEKALGGEDMDISDKCKLSVFKELYLNEKYGMAYLIEVLDDSKLANLREESSEDIDEISEQLHLNANHELNDITDDLAEDESNDSDRDEFISNANNHLGTYTNYMKHLSPRVKNYFNSLDKLVSIEKQNDQYVPDTNNRFGLNNTMNAEECSTILYSCGNFNNVESMIKSINDIAKNVKGFEAFAKVAEDLDKDTSLAYEIYTIFAKAIMPKVQVMIENGIAKAVTSNQRSNSLDTFVFQMINDLRGSVVNLDYNTINNLYKNTDSILNTVTDAIKKVNNSNSSEEEIIISSEIIDEKYEQLANNCINLLRMYYPSLQTNAIECYIDLNQSRGARSEIENKINNIKDLLKIVNNTKEAALVSKATYDTIQLAKDKITYQNKQLDLDSKNGVWHSQNEYKSVEDLDLDYLSDKHNISYIELCNKLLPYSIVQLQFNSPNVEGNNSSDIINNSWLTNFKDLLEDTYYDDKNRLRNKRLEEWGLNKLRSKQYAYSNILLEQYDDNGKPINKAIFRDVNGQLCLTNNWEECLKIFLFDGSRNIDDNKSLTYHSMGFTDYFPTSFSMFNNPNKEYGTRANINATSALYFLRTPSDAPKNFVIKGERYESCFVYDLNEATNKGEQAVKMIPQITKVAYDEVYSTKDVTSVDVERAFDYIKRISDDKNITIPTIFTDSEGNKIQLKCIKVQNKDTDEVTVNVGIRNSEENIKHLMIFRGNAFYSPNVVNLKNVKLEGVVSLDPDHKIPEDLERRVESFVRDETYTGKSVKIGNEIYAPATKSVNVNSKTFNAIKNIFKQELLNAAVALNTYFKTDDTGWVEDDKGDETKKTIVTKISNTQGYKFYHLDGNGEVLGNKNGKYTLNGKVFHSTKFTITKDVEQVDNNGDTKVVTQSVNYLDKLITVDPADTDAGFINLLYGGSNGNYLHVTKDQDGNVANINLTPEQDKAVNDRLVEFITDYINQSLETAEQYKDNLGKDYNINNVESYALSYFIMYNNFDDLFEGESKFYKDSQTFLKRDKEIQASGISYAHIDRTAIDNNNPPKTVERSFLTSGKYNGRSVQDILKGSTSTNSYLTGTVQRDKFYGVTIKNSNMTNEKLLNSLVDKLVNECNVKRSKAEEILYGPLVYDKKKNTYERKGGFTDTTVNDAQSYITINEFIRRIDGRGQLKRYMPLIEKLLDETKPLSINDIQEWIQVQKNIYYDLHYDKDFGIEVPRQIKNAEFVLVPRLIKGTELEQVYYLMMNAGVDQLNTIETSKAANKQAITLWDDNGNLVGKDTFVAEARNKKEIFNYKYLYTQQETPQHVNAKNKAGIQILKKIVDNIKPGDKLYDKKQEFFRLVLANIEDSYKTLMERFKVPLDDNGNIITKEDGTIEGLDLNEFYKTLKDEMLRVGVDSNILDCVTIDPETNLPIMKPLSNSIINKFETVVQSIFNNNITRQKLPGFHGPQVTSIGWGKSEDVLSKIEQSAYNEELRYHPDGKPYIEVMLPASNFGIDKNSPHYRHMTDEQIIKELEAKGLDIIMGYRIPTEGKQSVCNMKVVGFTDDALGSTIVVPYEWVAQTGSDFDVDSVYGIQYETYVSKNGAVHKVKYISDDDKEIGILDYFDYVKNNISKSDKLDLDYSMLQKEENDLIDSLSDADKNVINAIKEKAIRDCKRDKVEASYTNRLNYEIDELTNIITQSKESNDSSAYDTIDKMINVLSKIVDVFKGVPVVKNTLDPSVVSTIENNLDNIEAIALDNSLLSYEEFKKQVTEDPEHFNSRKARNNRLLDVMKEILGDTDSLEENLMRSNFETIIYWRNKLMPESVTTERKNRNPYNVFDQMKFQEDATSGMDLKGVSVFLDSFCSICNTVRPKLNKSLKVVYTKKDLFNPEGLPEDKETLKDNEDSLKAIYKRFDNVEEDDETITVTHDTYGWTNDNYNIDGRLLTAYSSQTTAHILDAIKEGNIPGVNIYTFPVYKTIVNIGSNYQNAISFIMQPGIKRIIDNYNKTNSIFIKNKYGLNNPIHASIREIAKELGVNADDSIPMFMVMNMLNSKYKDKFNEIFGNKENELNISLSDSKVGDMPFIVSNQVDRLKNTGKFSNETPVEGRLLFDLGIILQFNRLNNIAGECGAIARCCNSDKFGAKQTVFETNDIFRSMIDIINKTNVNNSEEEDVEIDEDDDYVLSVDGKHILQSIFPGIEEGTVDYPAKGIIEANRADESSYRTLYGFLKYASSTSTIIAKTLFDTQNPKFIAAIQGFVKVMSDNNPKITEELNKDLQRYILLSYYNNISSIKYPISVENGKIVIGDKSETEDEHRRIFGFGQSPQLATISVNKITTKDSEGNENTKTIVEHVPFEVEDISNPTNEEIQRYLTLSPAQKVKFIQSSFIDSGVFSLLDVSLYNAKNTGKYKGMQTISYNDQSLSSNVVYSEFKKAFFNDNLLIQLAAFDLVKYAVVVEGLIMKQSGVTKMIDNSVLLGEFGNEGTGFMDELDEQISLINRNGSIINNTETLDNIYENYLRSHPDTKAVKTLYLSKRNKDRYSITFGPRNTIIIKGEIEKSKVTEFNQKLARAGILKSKVKNEGNVYKVNSYIRIKDNNYSTLYKINRINGDYILYPLNNLKSTEVGKWSANSNSNRYASRELYEYLLQLYRESSINAKFNSEFTTPIEKNLMTKEYDTWQSYFYGSNKVYDNEATSKDFDIETIIKDTDHRHNNGMMLLKTSIQNHFTNHTVNTPLYVRSNALTNYIFVSDGKYGSRQTIKMADGSTRDFIINKVNTSKYNSYLRKKAGAYVKSEEDFNKAVSKIKNSALQELIKPAREERLSEINDIYVVTPAAEEPVINSDEPTEMFSAFEEPTQEIINDANTLSKLAWDTIDYIKVESKHGNNSAENTLSKLNQNNITVKEENIANNIVDVINALSSFAVQERDAIIHDFDVFVEDPINPETYYKATDPKVQELLENNKALQDKYLYLLNRTKAFINKFAPYYSFNVTSDDTDLNFFMKEIKNAYVEVSALPLNDLVNNFARGYVKKLTNNPLIVADVIDVMENYWKTYGSMWMFNDVAENGNPLLQTILKDVMGDIDAKSKQNAENIRKFRKKWKEIEQKAKDKGFSVDVHKFIDENGMFMQDYANKFVEDYYDLLDNVHQAAQANGFGSIEHLKAKNDFDIFKAKHVHQEVVPEYYVKKATLEYNMIVRAPRIYSEYMKLYYKRLEIYDHISKDGLNKEYKEKLDEVNLQMRKLYKSKFNPNIGDIENDSKVRADYEEALMLREYVAAMRDLNEEYFESDSEFGFEHLLNINKKIVESFEKRDEKGIPTVPTDVLNSHPEYVKAKRWLKNNAKFALTIESDPDGEGYESIGARLKEAFDYLSLRSGKHSSVGTFAEKYDLYDEDGDIDASKLTDEQLAKVKDSQEGSWQVKGMPQGTDRILISNARPDTEMYSERFYAGMKSDGYSNPKYLAIVTKLNKYLEKYYNPIDGIVHLENIPDTKDGIRELYDIADLYQQLREQSKTLDQTNTDKVKDFINKNVKFETNKVAYMAQLDAARDKSTEYQNAWMYVNLERKEDGEFVYDKNGVGKPNRFLYSYAKPKAEKGTEEYNKFVDDTKRSKYIELVNHYYRKVPNKYYYKSMHESLARAEADPTYSHREWIDKNHIWNPYLRKMEPLDIWMTSEFKYELMDDPNEALNIEGQWLPKGKQKVRKIRTGITKLEIPGTNQVLESYDKTKDKRNENYNPNTNIFGNYIKGSYKGIYDNNVELNPYEKELRDYIINTLMATATTKQAKRWFEKGNAPAEVRKDNMTATKAAKEVGKMFGLDISRKDYKSEYREALGYEYDYTPKMPMTDMLTSKALGSSKFTEPEPDKNDIKAHNEWEARRKEVEDKNKEIHKQLLNTDWENVMCNYLEKAGRFNAIQDNKNKLYYLLNVLRNQEAYMRSKGFNGDLKLDTRRGTDENPIYETAVDKNLVEQYETFLRRLLFDQWKEDTSLNNFATKLQGFTSASYMMLNVRGGFANVNLGEVGIVAEAVAKEYFGVKDWVFGTKEWTLGSIGYARHMYDDKACNVQDAIIKYMNVVDYDEWRGVSLETKMEKYSERIRNAMFSPQTIGEHFMQNSALFAMMHSHKLVTLNNDPLGIGATFMNKEEYIRYRQVTSLSEVLTKEQLKKLDEFKKIIASDKNNVKDYAWWRKDIMSDFIGLNFNKEQRDEIIKKIKQQRETIEKDFDKLENLYDQCILGEDGYLDFKEGSDLANLAKETIQDGAVNKAHALLGRFAERTRKVNNKIHGVYNRMGQAYIERKWYGSLVMQYHKHLPMGILKRYRRRGYFNETRGTVEKGMLESIKDFCSLNTRIMKHDLGWTDEEENAVISLQNIIKGSTEWLMQVRQTLDIMPEYDKANLYRNLLELAGVTGGIMIMIAVLALGGGDDDDNIVSNFLLYEGDRLASEAFLYNPIGLVTETKTLMSTPIAAQSIVTDILSGIGNICMYLTDDEADIHYKTGRFAGENKIKVYFTRHIPIYHGIESIVNIADNNHYFKIGTRGATIVPTKDIAKHIQALFR